MWYFIIKQQDLNNRQYQYLQRVSSLTEVEVFNEPYYNFCLFEIENSLYKDTIDYLDTEGIVYELAANKPDREHLLAIMK